MTLNEFTHGYPVKSIHLYRPDPRDWFRDVMQYLNRVHDWNRRIEMLKLRVELLDDVDDPDEELSCYRDGIHQKLCNFEQAMRCVRVEAEQMIKELGSVEAQIIITRRYLDRWSWKKIAWALNKTVDTVQAQHADALPELKRILTNRGMIPDAYIRRRKNTATGEKRVEDSQNGEQKCKEDATTA